MTTVPPRLRFCYIHFRCDLLGGEMGNRDVNRIADSEHKPGLFTTMTVLAGASAAFFDEKGDFSVVPCFTQR